LRPVKSSARKYLVVSSILAIFGITLVLFVNSSNLPLLKLLKKSPRVQYDCIKFHSCIFKLYQAETSCRIYLVSEDRIYYKLFNKEIAGISLTAEAFNHRENLFTSIDFACLIALKSLLNRQFIFPKRLLNGLINFSVPLTYIAKSTVIKTTINDYYLQIYLTNNKVKKIEKRLCNINELLILTIVERLEKYKSIERNYHSAVHQIDDMTVLSEIKNLDKFTRVLLALTICLLASVFYVIYHFYQNEKALIAHSDKAAYYAISKSRFLANMSHEIRTPLNSIIGFSEQLAQINLGEKQREQVRAIKSSSIMLLEVVNDILDFSKYETGKVILEQIPFSPYAAIKDVFDSMSVQATKKKIGFKMDLTIDDDVYILGDPLRLKQVVMNLLSNAIKFTSNGTVTLYADLTMVQEGQAKLNVNITDTGMGINPVDQQIIFDEFAQVYYPSTTERQQGTGLGLAICKKIVEFQGGTIHVESAEGKGSVFSFELSYQTTAKPVLIESPTLKLYQNAVSLTGKRILLVDDNMLNILLISTILKKYKISFDEVSNGKEAYKYFKENEYDLILTDIQMPEMGGVELAQEVRKDRDIKKKNTPILGVTANVLQEDRLKYLASGMNELVLKPFLEHELLEKILTFIR
jgi:signal transduction histidine kinase/CheY-like chemotaxis protein